MMTAQASPVRPPLRRRLVSVHRWLSLGAAVFWLLQALTGILIAFHWEISDRSASEKHRPTDLAAIEKSIGKIMSEGGTVASIWTTAGLPDRYNLYFEDRNGASGSARMLGDGSVIDRPQENDTRPMAFLVGFHHDLLGAWGSWIVSISGILLCSNLLLGLYAAWPRRGTWRTALVPSRRGAAAARLYSWHRAIGLWAVMPALAIATTGTMLKFETSLAALVGAEDVALPPNAPAGPPVGFAAAATAAMGAVPGSSLTQVAWPDETDATYRVRVRAPGELRRAYGATIVLVDANDARVRGIFPIGEAEAGRAFMSALFPIHTGEAGGLAGRLLLVATGLWLISMIILGTLLWSRRRRPARAAGNRAS